MRNVYIVLVLLIFPFFAAAQNRIDRLIIVTTDGLRWQEVFAGMDSAIAVKKNFNQGDSSDIFRQYWRPGATERRQALMPFLWSTIAGQGQVWGNRTHDNHVATANKYWFSYPGYNEIFTGYPDTAVNSNSLPDNVHQNVLEYLNKQSKFKGSVAAFGAWKAFNQILAEKRSGFPVVAAFDTVAAPLNNQQALINAMLLNSYKPFNEGECLDVFTHYAAMEYMKKEKPKLIYIAYGETDEWAHAGQYHDYLHAATQVDTWLKELWQWVQSTPEYKDRTALLLTVDHGRGTGAEWTSHGSEVKGADQIWFAVMGPGIPHKGEVKTAAQLYQQGFAQTIANLLGETFKANHPVAESMLPSLLR